MEELGGEEYSSHQWETETFLEAVDWESFGDFDWSSLGIPDEQGGAVSSCNGASNSSDGSSSSTSSKAPNNHVISERIKRRRHIEKLYNLRSVVPNITKMDKVSIIKDAIDYIQKLQEEERKIMAEMPATACEEWRPPMEQNGCPGEWRKKKKTTMVPPPIQVTHLQFSDAGERTWLLSIRCQKGMGIVSKLFKVLDSLGLKILSGNITSLNGQLLHNLLVETDETERTQLKEKIEMAISGPDATRNCVALS
ncbi:hypothetical protein Taro_002583 [Colocasia esculenta]|uniref:BHLH domain-containing protein n=1 Tax=Colocasia esculenta TaxID=4460 RepID=A0A843TD12_COLES|nr:hypothetical protein [Colocasia esculenta]